MAIVSLELIFEISRSVLIACGVGEPESDIIADSIRFAHLSEIPSHGIGRLPLYVKMIECGCICPKNVLYEVKKTGSCVIVDSCNGFGQIAGQRAVEIGTELASTHGISVVGIRNSNNFGAASYYGRMTADQGFICLIFANAAPAIVPPGGRTPIFGTNPLCIAFPGSRNNAAIVLDMAMSVAARGKVRLAAKKGETIPIEWAVDSEGTPTNNPLKALEGALLSIGGYKGFALSLMIDMLAGLITGSAYGGDVLPLSDATGPSRNGHLFIFMKTDAFLEKELYFERFDGLVQKVRGNGNLDRAYLPGDLYQQNIENNLKYVELPDPQISEINLLLRHLGISRRIPE